MDLCSFDFKIVKQDKSIVSSSYLLWFCSAKYCYVVDITPFEIKVPPKLR